MTGARKQPVRRAQWAPVPFDTSAYRYDGAALRKHWARLHQGDREPFPDVKALGRLLSGASDPVSREALSAPDAFADRLQQAWRLYHQGAYQRAADLGAALGPLGVVVAAKAAAIHATHVEPSRATRLARFRQVAEQTEQARAALPAHANLHYLHAYALGRHAQAVSVLDALTQGIGGKIKAAVDRALALEPACADAHSLYGTWHAEIIAKVGRLLAGLTYGASTERAIEHYERALKLAPQSAVARNEYADALLMLFGEERRPAANRLYAAASRIEPADAMEQLEAERARASCSPPS